MVTNITVAESAAFLNFFLAGLLLFCCRGLNTFLRSSLTSQTAQDDLPKMICRSALKRNRKCLAVKVDWPFLKLGGIFIAIQKADLVDYKE